ncbi:lactate permease [Dichotomocladium elegans]|nr:lactate permease [Dichotomocladium elegans]
MVDIPQAPPEAYASYFVQPLAPIGGSLVGSFFVGLIPLFLVLIFLGVVRLPAYASAFISLVVCIFIAIFGWDMPAQQAFSAIANGLVFANWPIMWIVFHAMLVYNVAVRSGVFTIFRRWMLTNTPADKRVFLLLVAFSFCAVLEGVAGFGTPGAICSALLVSLGFEPLQALTFVLLFDTTPVAFGALGIPVTTLGRLTDIEADKIAAMLGRILPLFSLFLPVYGLYFYAGWRAGVIECWPLSVVAGISFAVTQGIFANLVGPELPDLLSGLVSLLSIIVFVQFWKPKFREEFRATMNATAIDDDPTKTEVQAEETSEQSPAPTLMSRLQFWKKKQPLAPALPTASSSPSSKPRAIRERLQFWNNDKNNSAASVASVGSGLNVANPAAANDKKEAMAHHVEIAPTSNAFNRDEEMAFSQGELEKPSAAPDLVKPTLYETVVAWSPWASIVIVVIIWTFANVSKYGAQNVQFPHLHNRVWLTLYDKPYAAIWAFEPLCTGTAILIANILFSIIVIIYGTQTPDFTLMLFKEAFIDTCKQLMWADVTVSLIMAFAYLYNYSGIVYTIGLTLSQVGRAFPFLSAWIGWIGCFLTGSDTSANSLFGNLQVVAAKEIGLSAILMAATNTAGAVTSKMISPQTLTTGVSTIRMHGKEGQVLRRTIPHSLFFVCLVGAITCFEQYVIPGIIPPEN